MYFQRPRKIEVSESFLATERIKRAEPGERENLHAEDAGKMEAFPRAPDFSFALYLLPVLPFFSLLFSTKGVPGLDDRQRSRCNLYLTLG